MYSLSGLLSSPNLFPKVCGVFVETTGKQAYKGNGRSYAQQLHITMQYLGRIRLHTQVHRYVCLRLRVCDEGVYGEGVYLCL